MKQFRVVRGGDASESHLEQAISIDTLIYCEEDRGIYNNCLEWFKKNPHIYTFLLDEEEQKVVAYINAMPVKEELYKQIILGNIEDRYIDAEDILAYEDNTDYVVYFCSLAVHPDYQATKAFSLLYDAYFSELVSLSDRGVRIEKVIAEGVSDKGSRVCRLSGLQPLATKINGIVLYELRDPEKDFKPLSSTAEKVKEFYMKSTN